MSERAWPVGLVAVYTLVTASVATADLVSVDLEFSPPTGGLNTLDVSIALSGLGSDSETVTVTGNVPIDLQIDFHPATHEADITGITFHEQVPGSIALSDMHFRFLQAENLFRILPALLRSRPVGERRLVSIRIIRRDHRRRDFRTLPYYLRILRSV